MNKIFFIFLMITTSIFSQKQVNEYKYVIVANKFDFLKEKDQYQTSSLTKFLFNKYGFSVFLADENLPVDLVDNKCLALFGSVKSNSSLFITKAIVELRDCSGNIVYSSKEGKSKIKDYKRAYHEAIRNAFKSIKALKYKYTPIKNDVVENTPVPIIPKIIKNKVVVSKQKGSFENLYAQPIANGFQLVNTKPAVVFQILKTNVEAVFIIKGKNGILYKTNTNWIAEYYKNGDKVIEKYHIKF